MNTLATISDYDAMIEAMRARMQALGLTNQQVDELTGLQSGYTGKLFGPARVKNVGPLSFGLLNQVLAVKWVMVQDDQALHEMEHRYEQRERPPALQASRVSKALLDRVKPAFYRDLSVRGNAARNRKLSGKKRSEIARCAAKARWSRRRKATRVSAARAAAL